MRVAELASGGPPSRAPRWSCDRRRPERSGLETARSAHDGARRLSGRDRAPGVGGGPRPPDGLTRARGRAETRPTQEVAGMADARLQAGLVRGVAGRHRDPGCLLGRRRCVVDRGARGRPAGAAPGGRPGQGPFPCRWRFDLEAGLRTGYVTAGNSADCSGRQGSLTLSVRLLRRAPASQGVAHRQGADEDLARSSWQPLPRGRNAVHRVDGPRDVRLDPAQHRRGGRRPATRSGPHRSRCPAPPARSGSAEPTSTEGGRRGACMRACRAPMRPRH